MKGNAHVETDDQKVEVVAQAYAGAYGNVFQVFSEISAFGRWASRRVSHTLPASRKVAP